MVHSDHEYCDLYQKLERYGLEGPCEAYVVQDIGLYDCENCPYYDSLWLPHNMLKYNMGYSD